MVPRFRCRSAFAAPDLGRLVQATKNVGVCGETAFVVLGTTG
ncbi:hypothetical protein ONA91_38880 [Micromonospora sp. DR5-3]|nr:MULTISPECIES: hypothetical protein [unclassified Micromonospora]MCW3820412.1 hypothetical protein [Micromonospora sp. DR5-3]